MVMRRDGSKSGTRAYSPLNNNGFPATDLSDQSPMLFVDLLTRPRHQGEALREPRLRHSLQVSIILLLRQHVFHSCCSMHFYHRHFVGAMPPMVGWGYPHHQALNQTGLETLGVWLNPKTKQYEPL